MNKHLHNTHSKRSFSRRDFLQISALASLSTINALALTVASTTQVNANPDSSSKSLPLKIAGYRFPRVAALADGQIKIEGCDIVFRNGKIGDMNTDVFSGKQSYDVTEIGLHPYMLAFANDHFRDYTLLPIFPLRLFRHKSIFIRTDRGIKKPEDLKGKIIATPGYSSTSLTWIRGILQDQYGVKPEDIQWIISSKDSSAKDAGKVSKQENKLPDNVLIRFGPEGKDESDLLLSGEVDALFHAAEPKAYLEGNPIVARLFPDYRRVERNYYKISGIFPIMHAVAIKRSVLEPNPWLAEAVFNAYSKAKLIAYRNMEKSGWYMDMLPWYGQELEETQRLMGDNFYSYGIEPNRKALETLFRYSFQQGLSSRELTIETLFAPASLSLTEPQ